MTKVSDLDGRRKPPPSCQYCGESPPCPGLTCKRIASVTHEIDGAVTVTFIETIEISFRPDIPPTE